jgi:hypothetical protein
MCYVNTAVAPLSATEQERVVCCLVQLLPGPAACATHACASADINNPAVADNC